MDYSIITKWMENSIVDEILLLAIIIAILEMFAQNNLKMDHDYSYRFTVGIIFYIGVGCILHYGYDKFALSKLNIIWSSISITGSMLLGYYLYDEPVSDNSILAVIFALLAIYFISK